VDIIFKKVNNSSLILVIVAFDILIFWLNIAIVHSK